MLQHRKSVFIPSGGWEFFENFIKPLAFSRQRRYVISNPSLIFEIAISLLHYAQPIYDKVGVG